MKNGSVDLSSAFVVHFRDVPPRLDKKALTVVAYNTDKGLVMGIAACSKKDQFSRRMGRTIAANRALKVIDWYGGEIRSKPTTKEDRQTLYKTAHDVIDGLPMLDHRPEGVRGSTALQWHERMIVVTPL